MGPRRRSCSAPGATLLAACCLGALSALRGPWLPAQVPAAKVGELNLDARSQNKDFGQEPRGCEAALAAGTASFEPVRAAWAAAAEAGRLIPDLGKVAEKAQQRVLDDFDRGAEPGRCAAQRASLQSTVRREAWNAFLAQRQLTEQDVGDELADRLLSSMKRRGGPLRVQEKVDMLRDSVRSYNSKVQRLLPEWVEEQGDAEKSEAERRLGELQFRIEDTQEGRMLRAKWDQARIKKVMNERAHGMSLSLDPGLRLMIRPEGLGNLQVFSVGPAGPPNNPAQVQIGILNDGSIADVYREHPTPPKIALQPAVKVHLNLR
mmetsp:Transcript_73401/g.192463  ORF Transcript_73401/g.192463 Transcript_73401/m.192463 type:complete len:319 (-) Transcript_73401:146-1102(-)